MRGLLSSPYFVDVILTDLKRRYRHVGHWLLDAADYGVPQHRRRVFVWAGPAPLVPPTRPHGPGMFTQPWVPMRQALPLDGAAWLHHMRNTDRHPNQERPTPSTEPAPAIGGRGNQYVDRPAPTVTTADGQGVGSSDSRDILEQTIDRRRLTPAECATLQGFPDGYPWHVCRTKRAQYRAIGNAVPPALAQAVASVLC